MKKAVSIIAIILTILCVAYFGAYAVSYIKFDRESGIREEHVWYLPSFSNSRIEDPVFGYMTNSRIVSRKDIMYGVMSVGVCLCCVYEYDGVSIEYNLYEGNNNTVFYYATGSKRYAFSIGSYYYILEANSASEIEIVAREFNLTPYQRCLTRTY